MVSPRSWSLISMGSDQQYAGNRGYVDDLRRIYRYDSNVANHRNVTAGDLVLLRDRNRLIGIAQVESITSKPGQKTMLRCPECGITDLKGRVHKRPEFRCDRGHEFEHPREDVIDVTAYEAHYANTYEEAPDAVPVAEIKAAAPRRSDQLSIEEVDVSRFERSLVLAYPATLDVLARFYQLRTLDPDDASDDPSIPDERSDDTAVQRDSYASSVGDTRKSVLRALKERRGQRKFRNALLKRYGAACAITGCNMLDVLEAAHIWPLRGDEDNHPENGLVLRADIHTLFDLDRLAIEPTSLKIHLAPKLREDATYRMLHAQSLRVMLAVRPALGPLERRWETFLTKWDLPRS
jgi:putative restriction endonuclease